jgi:hypothetical protein
MYRIAAELPEHLLGIAIAFVDRHADQAELNSFGELVAQNRGVSGRYFNTRATLKPGCLHSDSGSSKCTLTI